MLDAIERWADQTREFQTLKERDVQRIRVQTDAVNPLLWLHEQEASQKIYWRSRDHQLEVAGVGTSIEVNGQNWETFGWDYARIQSICENLEGGRFFGGMRFDAGRKQEEAWTTYPAYYFRLPLFELMKQEDKHWFACNIPLNTDMVLHDLLEEIKEQLRTVSFENFKPTVLPECCAKREDEPLYASWRRDVESVVNDLSARGLEKVVLARKTTFTFTDDFEPATIVQYMKESNPYSFLFIFQNEKQHAFLGSSPERLFSRHNRKIETEAVAGTRPRGQNAEEDQRYKEALLNSAKDMREHRFVVDSIGQALRSLCTLTEHDRKVSILENARVQHLYLPFQGYLKEDINDADLIAALHPTPAVGGWPAERAMHKIREIEHFDRGWYAAPVGWIGRNAAEFAVAIRSGLIEKRHLHLYAGAGIVKGSIAKDEWQEVENKIGNFLKLIKA